MKIKLEINGKALLAALALSGSVVFANYVSIVDVKNAGGIIVEESSVPVGSIQMWGKGTPPSDWLELNGQSTSGYPELAKLYGSNVPDLRGKFIRAWDNGKGIDNGRSLLSTQDWAIENITGQFGIPKGHDGRNLSYGHGGAFFTDGAISGNSAEGTNQAGAVVNKFDASKVVKTSNETRPINISMMYIIKAK
jgi:hypothetical protein